MNIPFSLPCMGCNIYKPSRVLKYPIWLQAKLQGIRARYWTGTGEFYSRGNETWHSDVVYHMKELIKDKLPDLPNDIMLDGEFYCHGWTQGEHTSNISVKLTEPTAKTLEVKFMIFDFWRASGTPRSFYQRQAILMRNDTPNRVAFTLVQMREKLEDYYEACLQQGFEGVIIVKDDCPYKDGKSYSKLKRKEFLEKEFKCMGFETGTGKYRGMLGALKCQANDNGDMFNVGTGFTDQERKDLYNMSVLGKQVTVKYQSLSEDGIPQHPVFVAIRNYE